jgi:hypothetical protein
MNAALPLDGMMRPRFNKCFIMISQNTSIGRAGSGVWGSLAFTGPGSLQPQFFIPTLCPNHLSRRQLGECANSLKRLSMLAVIPSSLLRKARRFEPSACWSRNRGLDEDAPDSVQ